MRRFTVTLFVRKKVLLCVVLVGILGLGAVSVWANYLTVSIAGGLAPGRVVLDAGHGGIDPGTHDRGGVLEKDITLDVVLRLGDYLTLQGVPVEFTRETDRDVTGSESVGRGRHRRDLEGRLRIFNRGNIAVSVHVNSSRDADERGAVIFFARDSEPGKRLAGEILRAVGGVQTLNHDYVVPRSNLYLLRVARVPSVLVEMGFISNQEDKRKLQDPGFRQQMAVAIAEGILRFLQDKQ